MCYVPSAVSLIGSAPKGCRVSLSCEALHTNLPIAHRPQLLPVRRNPRFVAIQQPALLRSFYS